MDIEIDLSPYGRVRESARRLHTKPGARSGQGLTARFVARCWPKVWPSLSFFVSAAAVTSQSARVPERGISHARLPACLVPTWERSRGHFTHNAPHNNRRAPSRWLSPFRGRKLALRHIPAACIWRKNSCTSSDAAVVSRDVRNAADLRCFDRERIQASTTAIRLVERGDAQKAQFFLPRCGIALIVRLKWRRVGGSWMAKQVEFKGFQACAKGTADPKLFHSFFYLPIFTSKQTVP